MQSIRALSRLLVRAAAAAAAAVLVSNCGGGSSDSGAGRSAPTYRIGGTFTGLAEGSITVAVGLDRREIATQGDGVIRDIAFEMPSRLPSGVSYDLRVLRADANVSCEVRNGRGVVGQADVTDVLIQCFSTPSLRLLAGRLPKPDVDGIATDIAFGANSLAVAADGTIYLGADSGRGASLPLIRRITPTGFLTTIAGGSPGPAVDGQGADARLIRPRGLTLLPDGSLLFGDGTAVRRLSSTGAVSTLAGSLSEAGSVDTAPGTVAPDPRAARFRDISGLARAADGTIYVTDLGEVARSSIRSIAPDGRVSTVLTSDLQLNGLAVGLDGQLYVGTGFSFSGSVNRVQIGSGGATLVQLADPVSPPAPFGSLGFVADIVPETATSMIALGRRFGQLARYYTDGRPAEALAGTDGQFTLTKCLDGKLSGAQFNFPFGMTAMGPGKLLVADSICQSLRVVDLTAGRVSTLYGSLGFGTSDGIGASASFHGVSGLAYDPVGQRLASSEALGLLVRKVNTDGAVTSWIGEPTNVGTISPTGYVYVDGPAASATFASPSALVPDGAGGFFLLDSPSGSEVAALRQVDRNGTVTTLRADVPRDRQSILQRYLALDPARRFVVPSANALWRFGATCAFERIAGTGAAGYADSPAAPQFDGPHGIAVARDGTIFVADTGNQAVRRVASDGTVSTLAGSGSFTAPVAVALTENEDFLLVLDMQQFVVKAIDLRTGMRLAVRTVIGTAGANVLALGPLPGALAPPYQYPGGGQLGFLQSSEWLTHALLVKGSKLYVALGDAILEADLALH